MTDQTRQAAIEALAKFDDPLAKPGAAGGVVLSLRVPPEAREALRELARHGVNPSALMRQKLAEVLAEVGNGR